MHLACKCSGASGELSHQTFLQGLAELKGGSLAISFFCACHAKPFSLASENRRQSGSFAVWHAGESREGCSCKALGPKIVGVAVDGTFAPEAATAVRLSIVMRIMV